MINVRWTKPEATGPSEIFRFDESKAWKGSAVRGHDIAESIAESCWKADKTFVTELRITEPAEYRGEYAVWCEPIFLAKQTDLPAQPANRPKATQKKKKVDIEA